jgi:uncharacterized membrane protein YeaQ/YmgE (transglycosylase-associated protein family)
MSIETLVVWIIVGAIAGWLASIVMGTNGRQGLIQDIVVGVLGGVVGGYLFSVLGVGGAVTGINFSSIFVALIGGIVLLVLVRLLTGRRLLSR